MRPLLASHFSLALCLIACGPESSAPTPVETTPLILGAARQPTFGVSAGIRLARATVIEGVLCGLGPAGATFDSRIIMSSSGNATLVCRLRTAEGPKPALIVKDELCGIEGALTTEMHFVWTPSGKATLVCHLKK
jgi:hypothetical protein